MYYSLAEVYAIGIGPSSSHTVGPMKAAKRFVDNISSKIDDINEINIYLYGSLALTGVGHRTLNAIVYGLLGFEADSIDLSKNHIGKIKETGKLLLGGVKNISFSMDKNFILEKKIFLKEHSNGMKFVALDISGKEILSETYFSVGGGTVVRSDEIENRVDREPLDVPYNFSSFKELRDICNKNNLSIKDVVLKNEFSLNGEENTYKYLRKIAKIMQYNIDMGLTAKGVLPGVIRLKRRAPEMYKQIHQQKKKRCLDTLSILDEVNMWAFAVAEENACGGKIVTAPTMGSAGIMPAVMRYYRQFEENKKYDNFEADVLYLTTAAAICCLYRANASISGAEVGCQGEVGVACSMASAGLTAVLGGRINQIENSAEIAMEHNLGLTCDPVKGLVQIPCIERNAMAAVKAINASRLGLQGKGEYKVSLDNIIKTMYETGLSLNSGYKETSLAGLAKNVIC